jgi:hypothetical protein
MLEILQFVIERYSRIYEGKEDIIQDRIRISHTTVRNILREHSIEWRQSKLIFEVVIQVGIQNTI